MAAASRPVTLYIGIAAALIVAIVAFRSAAISLLAASGSAAPFAFVRESEAGSDAALQQLATAPITRAAAPEILSRAEAVAARYPLSVNAPFAAGMARAALGERDAATAAMQLTTQRNPRNRMVRTWLTDQALRRGDYASALRQLNALMRIEPTLADQISAAMVPFLFAPGMVDAFADVAVDRPRWLPAFIDQARREPRLAAQVQRLMLLIAQRRPDAVEPRNVAEVVTTAQSRGDNARALQILRAFYPTAYAEGGNLVFDPRLIGIDGAPPFDWTVADDRGQVDLGTAEGLQVSGSIPADTRVVGQTLVLAPGAYLFQARGIGDATDSFRWQIRCAGSNQAIMDIAVSDVHRATLAGGGHPFTVPARCGPPTLGLNATGGSSARIAVPSVGVFGQ